MFVDIVSVVGRLPNITIFNASEFVERKYQIYDHFEVMVDLDRNINQYIATVVGDERVAAIGSTKYGALRNLSDVIYLFWSK